MTSWTIYWFTRLDALHCCTAIICVALFCVAIIAGFVGIVVYDSFFENQTTQRRKCLSISIYTAIIGIVFMVLACLIPTTEEMAAIYLLPKIANNEQVQQVPDKAMQLLNGKLDEWIADVRGEKKEKK